MLSLNKQDQVWEQIPQAHTGKWIISSQKPNLINNEQDNVRQQQFREIQRFNEQSGTTAFDEIDKLQMSNIESKQKIGSEFQYIGEIIQMDQNKLLLPECSIPENEREFQQEEQHLPIRLNEITEKNDVTVKRDEVEKNPEVLEYYKNVQAIETLNKTILNMDHKMAECKQELEKQMNLKMMIALEFKKLKVSTKKKENQMKLQIQKWKKKYENENFNVIMFEDAFNKDKQQLKEMLQFYTEENQRLTEQINFSFEKRQRQVQKLKYQIQKCVESVKEKEFLMEKMKQESLKSTNDMQKIKDRFQLQISNKQKTIADKIQKIRQNQEQINLKNSQIKKITDQLIKNKNSLQLAVREGSSTKEKMESQLKKFKAEKQSWQKQSSKFQQELKKMEKEKKQLKTKFDEEKTKVANITKISNDRQREQNDKIQKLSLQLRKQKEANLQKIVKLTQQFTVKQEESQLMLNNKQRQISILQRQTRDFKETLEPIEEIMAMPLIDRIRENQTKNILFQRFLRGMYFPSSNILNEMSCNKTDFLQKSLKSFLQIKSFSTQLLYKFDPLNSCNFHSYIDGKKNILILYKLINGIVVGGLSASPFSNSKSVERPGKGFLFSLTAEKTFMRKAEPRVSVNTYDAYFLILGSSELRVKFGQKKLFSNFGVAISTFQTNGYPRHEFLGVKEGNLPEIEIESYEIYTINEKEI